MELGVQFIDFLPGDSSPHTPTYGTPGRRPQKSSRTRSPCFAPPLQHRGTRSRPDPQDRSGASKTPLTISTDICERRNATPCTSTWSMSARCRTILTLSALSHRLGDELIPKLAQIGW